MPDVLIRDLSEDVLARLDERARQAGVSRSEFLRRLLTREASPPDAGVSVDDLSAFAASFADLKDASAMDRAWH